MLLHGSQEVKCVLNTEILAGVYPLILKLVDRRRVGIEKTEFRSRGESDQVPQKG
jgi:hypothetical protein